MLTGWSLLEMRPTGTIPGKAWGKHGAINVVLFNADHEMHEIFPSDSSFTTPKPALQSGDALWFSCDKSE